jgi:hypothetical protein
MDAQEASLRRAAAHRPRHSLGVTQRYIEGDSDAKRKLIQMI